jgi:DNA polymerase type B, organellar and viral
MISTIIDDKNKFIQITLIGNKFKINWKDSYRIFSVSLNDLCKIFGVSGKTSKYDIKFNSIKLFEDVELLTLFKKYSLQDSVSLYQALDRAQYIYSKDYSVDIASTLSASSLSLKIFRLLFLKTDIPILKGSEDSFIRKGYFGGHTDYFKAYAKKLFYYDINSLYPFAMLKPMPHEMIKFHNNMSNIKLSEFFGFCLCEVTTPRNILKPLLPYKHNGKTIYPTGTWIGVYFSEELKAVIEHGYQINLIKGYEFSKIDLFSSYVNHFYDLKRKATGAARWIAKNHLNLLYGLFGRRNDLIQTMNINKKDLPKYLATKIVKTVININDEICTILIQNNINSDIIKELNAYFETNITNSYSDVKSNVAIAAAVTAYARIHMISYILNPGTVYTDTDSIFTTQSLQDDLLGTGLGLMKDELKGLSINEAYFLGIKRYGYWYNDSDKIIEQSVFAGITRNSLNFNEIVQIFNGQTISKFVENRFYKSFKNLTIQIKSVTVSIKMNNDKKLIGNNYIPLNVFNLNHNLDNRSLFYKIKNKLIKLFKHYL